MIARVVIALVLATSIARADDPPGSDRKAAEAHFKIGEKAYRAQNFAAAAEHLDAAYKALPLPEIAFSAAQAYRRWYRTEPQLETAQRAVELYEVYLGAVKKGGRVRDASDSVGEMRDEVKKLVAEGAKVRAKVEERTTRMVIDPDLLVEGGSTGSTLGEIADITDDTSTKIVAYLDGKQVPLYEGIEVTPDKHEIRVEAAGYITEQRVEQAIKNESKTINVTLRPKPARVTVTTEAGASIRVDGRAVGTTPLAAFDVPAGRHIVTISRPGRVPVAREIAVTRGQALAFEEPLAKTTRRKLVPYVAVGAGILAGFATTSAILAVVYDGRASDQLAALDRGDQPATALGDYERTVEQRDRFATGAWIAGGTAVLVGGLAAVLYFGDHPTEASSTSPLGRVEPLRVTPIAVRGTFGAALGGSF